MFPHILDYTKLLPRVAITDISFNTVISNAYEHVITMYDTQTSFLEHPAARDNVQAMHIQFHEPFFNLTTSKYADMEFILNEYTTKYIRMYNFTVMKYF